MKYFEGLKYVLIFEVGCWMVDVEFEILKVRSANFNPQTGTHKTNIFSLINFSCYYKILLAQIIRKSYICRKAL